MRKRLDTTSRGRCAPRRPPADVVAKIAELLERRPELAGIGLTAVAEAVTG